MQAKIKILTHDDPDMIGKIVTIPAMYVGGMKERGEAEVLEIIDDSRKSSPYVPSQKSAEGKSAEGESAEGKSAEGESAEGESAEGESAEGESAEGESAEGESAEGESAEGESAESEGIKKGKRGKKN